MAIACIPMYFAAKRKKKWLVLPFIVFYGIGTPTNVGVAGWLIFGEGDMATKQWLWGFLLLTGKAHLIICKTRKQKTQLLSSMEHLLRGGGIRPVSAPVRPLGPNK